MTGSFLKDLMHRVGSLAVNQGNAPADGDLLARFLRDRDEAAFAGILARHASLVWGVCRGLLPVDGDAEDAFQATFLALVRGAKTVRTPHSLAPWLHATATRVAKKSRTSSVRRAVRDRAAARSDANGSAVPDSIWDVAFLAVHEEIARLPEAMRSAFVLCVLEGDRHADAAAKLGVPVGTVSARVSRARDRLMEKLTARGLASASAAAGLALGGSAGPAAVPTSLIHTTCSTLVAGAATVPASILNLAVTATEGSLMKTKLLAAGVMIAAGLSLSGTAARFGVAVAQQTPSSALQPVDPRPGFTFNPVNTTSAATGHVQWEYRLVPRSQKAEMFERELKGMGKEGWEYAGTELLDVGGDTPKAKVVYKRPVLAAALPYSRFGPAYPTAGNVPSGTNPLGQSTYSPYATAFPSGTGGRDGDANAIIRVESGQPAAVAAIVSEVFNGPGDGDGRVSVSADTSAKRVTIRCSPTDAATIVQLLAKSNLATTIEMDLAPANAKASQPRPSEYPGAVGLPTTENRVGPTRLLPEEPHKESVSRSYSVPAHLTWKDAESKANDLAKIIGLSIKVEMSRTNEGYFHLILSGPKDDIEKFMFVLPGALRKPDDKTKE